MLTYKCTLVFIYITGFPPRGGPYPPALSAPQGGISPPCSQRKWQYIPGFTVISFKIGYFKHSNFSSSQIFSSWGGPQTPHPFWTPLSNIASGNPASLGPTNIKNINQFVLTSHASVIYNNISWHDNIHTCILWCSWKCRNIYGVSTLTFTTLRYFCINHGDQRCFFQYGIIIYKCLGLSECWSCYWSRAIVIIQFFQCDIDFRRQNL